MKNMNLEFRVHTLFKRLSILMIALSASVQSAAEFSMPPAQVSVVKVKERLIAPSMEVSGSVISHNDSTISVQVSGELVSIATVGSFIKKDDVIAEIDPTLILIELSSAKAQLEKLKADYDFRSKEVNRFKTLANKDNTSKARLQEELSKQKMLKQDIKIAESSVKMAQFYLAKSKVKAPFDGYVVKRLANLGEYLNLGDKLVRFVDSNNKEIVINAPMSLLPLLTEGKSVGVVAKEAANLPIKSIVPVGDNISRMVEVRLNANSVDWIIGTGVNVSLPKAEAEMHVAIPRDALVIKGAELYIFRVTSDKKAEKISAEIKAIDENWIAIKAHLNSGDQIIVRGAERLNDGQDVQIL